MSMKDGRYGKLPSDYASFACVFKYVTPATRTICIRDADDKCECGFEHEDTTVTGELIKYIKKVLMASNIRIDRLVMHTRSISISQHNYSVWDYVASNHKVYSRLMSCCDRLIWKGFSLTYITSVDDVPEMQFRIPLAVFPLERFGGVSMPDIFEKHLQWEMPANVDTLAQLSAELTEDKREDFYLEVMDILEIFQKEDPRSSAQYTDREWGLDNVDELGDLEVRKLNKICQYILFNRVKSFCVVPPANQSPRRRNRRGNATRH
ncbi:uncharacterized protein LOC129599598 [Paramacrobiotus metropolitanus]|uniref:uncharacterized protein LOC129599598 n=1 Tax=Paramacrobiotus metropolitanus TaxID=2943436 RepID=UPI0024459E58|nr:uncharacterized protein LOC129599598 [Paramacrobiotus metropolitanus]